jgi:hypothetical protein
VDQFSPGLLAIPEFPEYHLILELLEILLFLEVQILLQILEHPVHQTLRINLVNLEILLLLELRGLLFDLEHLEK